MATSSISEWYVHTHVNNEQLITTTTSTIATVVAKYKRDLSLVFCSFGLSERKIIIYICTHALANNTRAMPLRCLDRID